MIHTVPKKQLRLTLGAWRRLARKIDSSRSQLGWHRRIVYWLSSASHSCLSRIQHARYDDALKTAVPGPPIFLLGFWRSGTTFLHELFCCDTRFGFSSTYACLNPTHFLLTEEWSHRYEQKQAARRPMDDMRYSWASPQEDEFALLALGASSPYEALIAPSLMCDPRLLLDLRQRSREEQEHWKESLLYFLRLLTVQQGKPMILKSPPHGFKLPLLPALFPGARYVVIERNPYEVFASNLKMWQTLLDLYSLECYSLAEIEAFVLSAYAVHEETIAEGARQISPGSLVRIRYEDLVADPIRQMARLYMGLGIGEFETVRQRLEEHVAGVANHRRNRFSLSANQKARVDKLWGDLIREKGYSWCDDYVAVREPVYSSNRIA